MTAALKTKLTASEYLTLERQAEFKSEFFNGEMFAMAGASPRHNFIRDNLSGELYAQLKGSPAGRSHPISESTSAARDSIPIRTC